MSDRTTVEVSTETWRELNQRRRSGQTFNDAIQDALAPEGKTLGAEYEPEVIEQERVEGGECTHIYASGNQCQNDADYKFTMELDGKSTTVLTCEEHGNAPKLEATNAD